MKYGIAKFVVNPNGTQRISIQEDNPLIKPLLVDSFYVDNLKVNGFITEYFFEKPSDLIFTDKEIRNFSVVDFIDTISALNYIRTNTTLIEETPGNFLIKPEENIGGTIIPARYLSIV